MEELRALAHKVGRAIKKLVYALRYRASQWEKLRKEQAKLAKDRLWLDRARAAFDVKAKWYEEVWRYTEDLLNEISPFQMVVESEDVIDINKYRRRKHGGFTFAVS